MARAAGAVSGEAIRRERRRQRLSAEETAERYGDASMSHTVLMNIEASRRKSPASIDEWLRLAYVLGVPPESLLLPDDDKDQVIEIAPGVQADRVHFIRWLRGQASIGEVEPRHYAQIAGITLPQEGQRSGAEFGQEVVRRVVSMLDTVDTEAAEMLRDARRQIFDVLTDIEELVTNGTDAQEVAAAIQAYKQRLVSLS